MKCLQNLKQLVKIMALTLCFILSMALLSACNSATRVVTMSSDGSYSIRYIDSKTPVEVKVPIPNAMP